MAAEPKSRDVIREREREIVGKRKEEEEKKEHSEHTARFTDCNIRAPLMAGLLKIMTWLFIFVPSSKTK